MTDHLPPCEVTGKPCRWLSEEWLDDDGTIGGWDDFCEDCFKGRDWTKSECPETNE